MLLEFVLGIIRQLIVNVEKNVSLYPVAVHSCFLVISCPPTRPAIFGSHGTACSSPSLPSCSAFHRRSSISAPDNVSTQTPCVRAGLISPRLAKFGRLIRAASGHARD